MTRGAIALVAVLAIPTGCASTPTAPTVLQVRAGSRRRFALVPQRAWLYVAPDESAEHARVRIRGANDGYPNVVRVRHRLGDWYEVEPVARRQEDAHCYGSFESLSRLRIALYVRRADLARVTRRPVRREYSDGTAISLASGVVLVPSTAFTTPDRPVFTAYVDGWMLSVDVAARDVGDRYVPSDHFEVTEASEVIADDALMTFGGNAHVGTYWSAAPTRYVYERRPADDGAVATLRGECAQLEVRVNMGSIRVAEPALGGLVGRRTGTLSGPRVRAGARVYWTDGREAGTARRDVDFDGEIDARGGRRCFRKSLRAVAGRATDPSDTEHYLRVCVDRADIVD